MKLLANIEYRVPYSQRYLFNAVPDTNPNRNSKANSNPTNHNTRHCCEYDTINSMFAKLSGYYKLWLTGLHNTGDIFKVMGWKGKVTLVPKRIFLLIRRQLRSR